jgi:hypothetical protein
LIIEKVLEKLPHKNTAVEVQYMYNKMLFLLIDKVPEIEGRILEAIVERLC